MKKCVVKWSWLSFHLLFPIGDSKEKFLYSFIMKFNFQYWESVQFFLSFKSRVANLVSVSNLVINCTELPFERYIFKWSQLSFLLSFSIGNSRFNLKGDIILFVVSGNIQVQEKLFKILILPKVAIQRRFPYVAVQCS